MFLISQHNTIEHNTNSCASLIFHHTEFSDIASSYGLVPSNFTCASLLTMYYKCGDFSKALSLFLEMQRKKIPADEVIYGLLIRIYRKLGPYLKRLNNWDCCVMRKHIWQRHKSTSI